MKPLRGIALFLGCLLVLILAACNAETATPEVAAATTTPLPYPVAASPTAVTAPTAYPASATDTPVPKPMATSTAVPSPTKTSQPAQTFTPVPTPKVWKIWFRGFSCKGLSECSVTSSSTFSYFSVLSDGSGLEPLNINALPTSPLPTWLPKTEHEEFLSQAYFSPDGNWAAYLSRPETTSLLSQMYLVDLRQKKVVLAHETPGEEGVRGILGGICWSNDSQSIWFIETTRRGIVYSIPTVGRLKIVTLEVEKRYTLADLPYAWSGACSPDGQELMLVVNGYSEGNKVGLYRFNLGNGQWTQVLDSYFISGFQTAPSSSQP